MSPSKRVHVWYVCPYRFIFLRCSAMIWSCLQIKTDGEEYLVTCQIEVSTGGFIVLCFAGDVNDRHKTDAWLYHLVAVLSPQYRRKSQRDSCLSSWRSAMRIFLETPRTASPEPLPAHSSIPAMKMLWCFRSRPRWFPPAFSKENACVTKLKELQARLCGWCGNASNFVGQRCACA